MDSWKQWEVKETDNPPVTQLDVDVKSIDDFDFGSIHVHSTISLFGRRGAGKSTMLRTILYHMKEKLDVGMGMSPSAGARKDFMKYLPRCFIFDNYEKAHLESLIRTLNINIQRSGRYYNLFLLLDDCMYDRSVVRNNTTRELMMNGRHVKILVVNCIQYAKDVDPAYRSQTDFVFAMGTKNPEDRRKFWELFFNTWFPTYNEFEPFFVQHTKNRQVLVVDCRTIETDISKCVFVAKADVTIGRFSIVKKVFQQLDRNHYYNFDRRRVEEEMRKKSAVNRIRELSKHNPEIEEILMNVQRKTIADFDLATGKTTEGKKVKKEINGLTIQEVIDNRTIRAYEEYVTSRTADGSKKGPHPSLNELMNDPVQYGADFVRIDRSKLRARTKGQNIVEYRRSHRKATCNQPPEGGEPKTRPSFIAPAVSTPRFTHVAVEIPSKDQETTRHSESYIAYPDDGHEKKQHRSSGHRHSKSSRERDRHRKDREEEEEVKIKEKGGERGGRRDGERRHREKSIVKKGMDVIGLLHSAVD